jgi:hypothetical protein
MNIVLHVFVPSPIHSQEREIHRQSRFVSFCVGPWQLSGVRVALKVHHRARPKDSILGTCSTSLEKKWHVSTVRRSFFDCKLD